MDKRYKYLNDDKIEIWGGIECTINRVNDTFHDQLAFTGHYQRPDDLEKIASLGIRALRYPVLWEKHQPLKNSTIDSCWPAHQLYALKDFGITPIAGLVHHGSGPAFTNLQDHNFPELLAAYAKQVAQQFPWIEYYTPINEPLTTARFSGLYGLWYPHKKSDASYLKMLVNQLKGVVLSMKAIREINPDAKLVQTEDLAKIYSTPALQYQTEFENERRWLTYDLLCGKIDSNHYMWGYLKRNGLTEDVFNFFLENPCPPDIIGANYYVTSERYIDENIHDYPPHTIGGNGKQLYADVEAVRVPLNEPSGLKVLLKEVWERFQIPVAITEAHLNCTRDEQLRWFKYVYDCCLEVKEEVKIIAVTAWSLLGAFGWDKLLTEPPGNYECGVFKIVNGEVKPTAMVALIKSLAEKGVCYHSLFEKKGWWEREERYFKQPSLV